MTSKLERWAWVGGAVLAGIAGMVNAVGRLSYAQLHPNPTVPKDQPIA